MNAGETNDFARAIIMFDACGHIQRACGHATAQRLEYGIAADDEIIGFRAELCRAAACCQPRIRHLTAIGSLLFLVSLVIHSVFGLGSRSLAP